MAAFRTTPLDPQLHERQGFHCGEPSLDRYLHQQARQDMRRRLAVAYVLVDPIKPGTIVGTLDTAAAIFEHAS